MNPGWRENYLRYKTYFLNIVSRYKERADIKAYLEILLSLATISIFAIFALRPTLLTIASLIKENEIKKQTLDKMQSKLEKLLVAQTLYDRERQKINLLYTVIPDKPNPEIFARQIEGLSEKHNTEVSEITTGESVILGKETSLDETNSQELQSLPENSKSLSVSATYITDIDKFSSLSNLLGDLEKLRRPLKIDSLRILTTKEKEKKLLKLTIEARLPIYQESSD